MGELVEGYNVRTRGLPLCGTEREYHHGLCIYVSITLLFVYKQVNKQTCQSDVAVYCNKGGAVDKMTLSMTAIAVLCFADSMIGFADADTNEACGHVETEIRT